MPRSREAARVSGPTLLMGATHTWSSPLQVGAHHYARYFLDRGWFVEWLASPLTVPHLGKRGAPDIAERFADYRPWASEGNPTHLTPFTLLPVIGPGMKSTRLMRAWPAFAVPPVGRYIRRTGFGSPDLLYVDIPFYASLPDRVNARCFVYRVADFTPGFPGIPKAWEELERQVVPRADLVVYTDPRLEDYVRHLGARTSVLVENGVDVAHMAAPVQPPREYAAMSGPKAVYIGALRDWFDYQLLDEVCRRLPSVNFVVIGPDRHVSFRPRDNLHVLGQRSRDEATAYLQHADVGLIPFDVKTHPELINSVNPLKLYEYMAAGLPVVATSWPALERLNSPALLVDGKDEFVSAIERALEEREQLGKQGRVFASTADWSARLEPFATALRALGIDVSASTPG